MSAYTGQIYTDVMVPGIDRGVLCCEGCGALVPFHRSGQHDSFHAEVMAAGRFPGA